MSAYDYTQQLCQLRAWSSAKPRENPMTSRVGFILETLRRQGLDAVVDQFPAVRRPGTRYVNVSVLFKSTCPASSLLVVCAHHDVINPNSDNCQDNTASVAHLLALCGIFKGRPPDGNDILVAFLDAEEIVDPINSGAGRLSGELKRRNAGLPAYVLNLELTANGRNLWFECGPGPISPLGSFLVQQLPGIYRAATPYNDAVAFRQHGMDGVCIGSLDAENFSVLKRTGIPDTWLLCHSDDDSFEHSARRDDMDSFTANVERVLRASLTSVQHRGGSYRPRSCRGSGLAPEAQGVMRKN